MDSQDLLDALRASDLPKVKALLAAGANPESRDKTHLYALEVAAGYAGTAMVEALLDAGARVDGVPLLGRPLLPWAIAAKRMDLVELLLARGASVTLPDNLSATPLHHAAVRGPESLIARLLALGADPSVKTTYEMYIVSPKKKFPKGMTPHALAKALDRTWVALLKPKKPDPADNDALLARARLFFGDESAPLALIAAWRADAMKETHFSQEPYGLLSFVAAPSEAMPGFQGKTFDAIGPEAEGEALFVATSEVHYNLGLFRARREIPWAKACVIWARLPGEIEVVAPSLEEYFVLQAWLEDGRKPGGKRTKALLKVGKKFGLPEVTRSPEAIEKATQALAASIPELCPWLEVLYTPLQPSRFATS